MIYIQRTPTPPAFVQLEWRIRYLNALRRWLQQPSDQRGAPTPIDLSGDKERQIIQLIHSQFADKCAFCEAHLELEQQRLMYFRPRHDAQPASSAYHYYWLALDWSNLYLVCRTCRDLRGSEFPVEKARATAELSHLDQENAHFYFAAEQPLLLDPCIEAPIEHLDFHENGEITARNQSRRGRRTIEIFALNRERLVAQRQAEAQQLKGTWLAARQQMVESAGRVDPELVKTLAAACDPAAQFAGMKAYLLLEWMINETRIAPESAGIIARALNQEPWRRLHQAAMTTLRLKKPRSAIEEVAPSNADQLTTPIDVVNSTITHIYIQGDMYQIGTITDSTVTVGRGATSTIYT